MITIFLNELVYENDIYPLVKAFYPEEQIKVYRDKEDQPEHSKQEHSLRQNVTESTEKENVSWLSIDIFHNIISISFLRDRINRISEETTLNTALEKPQFKNAVKRALYDFLSKTAEKKLPWGILTGIRPTKLVYEMLEQEEAEASIHQKMKSEYYCSEEKINMSIRIAGRELELLKEIDYKNGYSLYIGIPFCPTTCLYCSFPSYSITKYANLVEDYISALEKEIKYGADCFSHRKLTTVYFGGGTPTTLTAEQLDRVLKLVRESFDFTHVKEFCVEAGRPDSITEEKLLVLKRYGVNRISINPQSMQDRTLKLIGRQHTVEEVKTAFSLARKTGHDNINMDIIIGLPGEKPEDVIATLSQIKDMNPDSLTVHTLAIKRAARLNSQKDEYHAFKASGVPLMFDETLRYAKENNYLPYYLYRQKNMADNLENIGYARYGKEGLYNILIMEEKQTILALGAGGMSKFVFHKENRIERIDNVKSVTDYISRIDEMILKKQNFLKENPQL